MPGALNKANSRQHSSNKASYEMQKQRTARNKDRNIKRQKRLIERTKRRAVEAQLGRDKVSTRIKAEAQFAERSSILRMSTSGLVDLLLQTDHSKS